MHHIIPDMITVDFSQRGQTSLYDYLYNSIKTQILDSSLAANTKLPSKRTLAAHLGISVITVQNAYAQLISEGYIYSIEKKGFFVTDISDFTKIKKSTTVSTPKEAEQNSTTEKNFAIDFTNNSTSAQKFPFSLWAYTMRQVLNSSDEKLLQRSNIKGILELRTAIASYLKSFRNMNVSENQIIVGAGTEALYSMLVQFFGREKIYGVENPGYKKVKQIFDLNGANCLPLEIDSQGISAQQLEANKIHIVHLSPNHHFPTGIVMPVRRRLELLNWVSSNKNHFIIEDDYDSEFRFNGKPLPTLQSMDPDNRIIYMNTFTKTLSPSFRISYMVLPENLISDFVQKLGSYSCQVSAFEQFTLARFMNEGHYEKHINKMKNHYRSVRNVFINELEKSPIMNDAKITEEEAGLHFLLTIKSNKLPEEIKKAMEAQGLNLPLLNDYFYGPGKTKDCTFVVNYSAINKETIPKVVKHMELALKNS